MNPEYQQKLSSARQKRKIIKRQIASLKKLRRGEVDRLLHPLHEQAFSVIDCLQCANCCKTTGPLFTTRDIDRIAAYLNMKPAQFIDKYLHVDEDDDQVLNVLPCAFLDDKNYCSIYEVRPKACRQYPHTDRKNQHGILTLTQKNAGICPAVAHIFEHLNV